MEQLNLSFEIPLALIAPDEIYQNAEALLQLLEENRHFDRKSARIQPRTLAESFSMWANIVPDGGLIAVGIEKDGSIGGCRSLSSSELNGLEQAGKTYCPDARNQSRLVPITNSAGESDFILLIRVHYRPDKVVYDSQGHAFTRIGDQKHQLTKEECRELEIDKGQVDYEQEPVLDMRYPEDFDLDLVSQFARAFRKSRGLSD